MLVELILEGGYFWSPIELQLCDDGEYEVLNGHHRVIAYWLSGIELRKEDYRVFSHVHDKRRVARVKDAEKIYGPLAQLARVQA